jgi:environmental stress-induced protein Ves
MFRVITPAMYRTMPWKNCGGRTTEIAAHPPGAALETFIWRASVADVASDGPFSRFPGIDRTITLLDGAGMRLSTRDRDVELRTPFEPCSFSGDDDVECTLVAGPIRDFNAMFRRGQARGDVAAVRDGGASIAPAHFRLVYAALGSHECVVEGHARVALATGHALLAEGDAEGDGPPMAVWPVESGGIAIAVRFECP